MAHGGARVGAGRKSKAEEFGLAKLLDDCWVVSDRKKVIQVLNKAALKGNDRAAALLLAYAYGKPTERHEHSNPDGSAILQPVADAMMKVYGKPSASD